MNCRDCDTIYTGPYAPQWVCEKCGCANWDGSVVNMGRVLAVDFDGVIHQYSRGWQDGRIYDPPMDGAILGMKKLQHAGWHLIIFTTRHDLIAVRDFMVMWWPAEMCIQKDGPCQCGHSQMIHGSLSHYGPNNSVCAISGCDCSAYEPLKSRLCYDHPIPQATNKKPGAHAYIDDRAFKFESWKGVMDEFVSAK